jgi:S1-C subfamily serine protease
MKKIINPINFITKNIITLSLITSSLTSGYFIFDNYSLRQERAELIQVQEQFIQLEKDKSTLDANFANLVNLNKNLNSSLNKVNADFDLLNTLNKDLVNKIDELEITNTELSESIKEKSLEIENLNKRIQTLSFRPSFGGGGAVNIAPPLTSVSNSNTQTLLDEINLLKSQLDEANNQKDLLTNQLNQLNTLVSELNQDLTQKSSSIDSLNLEIAKLEADKLELQGQVTLSEEQTDLAQLISAKDSEILTLNGLKTSLEQSVATLQTSLEAMTLQRNNFEAANTSLNSNITTLNAEIASYVVSITQLQTDVSNYINQVNTLNTTISNYETTLASNLITIQSLNNTISAHLISIEQLQIGNEELQEQLQVYTDLQGNKIDYDFLNQVTQLAVKANVKVEVGGVTGSGVVYKKEVVGNSFEFYILTNYHVIENHLRFSTPINVISYANILKPAELLAYQFHKTDTSENQVDLAVLKVITGSTNEYNVLELAAGMSEFAGQQVFSIGTPRSQINAVTVGEIINNNSNILLSTSLNPQKVFSNMIRHSALIDKGNSGGALIDVSLKIIGINFAGSPQTNTFPFQSVQGYAVPINNVHIFLAEKGFS